ncbi:MAG: acetate--CoA ligase family protein [Paracoccaceae bacterium]
MRDLSRLLNPRSIAVIGGGAWCESIIGAARRIGYDGDIVPVHPSGKVIAGLPSLQRLEDREGPIDAAFIGINRTATIEAVKTLRDLGAGGAVCFASGFSEAQAELADGGDLQGQLVAAAGDMPILGPNCYGFINALDRVAIWPDQHGMQPVDSGVAILTQSSNIAINLTMQQRALPIAYMVTCGNMAQTDQAQIAQSLAHDPRVTAIGVHIEGFTNLRAWEELARVCEARGIALVALKVGKSDHAQRATVSHTASLAGGYAGASALLSRLGAAQVEDIPTFLETLKLAHFQVDMPNGTIAGISCSGGEASLIADTAEGSRLVFPPLSESQFSDLRAALGPKVALNNPIDYHTYIWRDTDAMTATFAGMSGPETDLSILITDYPTTDGSDWECATDAVIAASQRTKRRYAVAATLPELMPMDVAQRLSDAGVVPLLGLREAVSALDALAGRQIQADSAVLEPGFERDAQVWTEARAKAALADTGLCVPESASVNTPTEAAEAAKRIGGQVVLKGAGLAHKSEHGAVRLNLTPDQVESAAQEIGTNGFLVEEMVTGTVAELLIGVTRDPAHGFLLTIAAGGVLTEVLKDSVSMLLPVRAEDVENALTKLKCAKLLDGYRGKPAADKAAIARAVLAIQDYVVAHADRVEEVEVNPLMCLPDGAVAADALIRIAGGDQ